MIKHRYKSLSVLVLLKRMVFTGFCLCLPTVLLSTEGNTPVGDPNSPNAPQQSTTAVSSTDIWESGSMKSSKFSNESSYGKAINRGILVNSDSIVKSAKEYVNQQNTLIGQSVHESDIKHIESFVSFQGVLVSALKIAVYVFLFLALLRIGIYIQVGNTPNAIRLAVGVCIAVAVIFFLPEYIAMLYNFVI